MTRKKSQDLEKNSTHISDNGFQIKRLVVINMKKHHGSTV